MSKLLVTFVCGRIQETNKNNVDENTELAYVSITGVPYPADENDKGEEVCRVWLLNEGGFRVTWVDEYYKRSNIVEDHIKLAKKDLKDYYQQKTGAGGDIAQSVQLINGG